MAATRKTLIPYHSGKHSRKSHSQLWKRIFYRCLIFFVLGVLVGMTPPSHLNDSRAHSFNFEIKQPHKTGKLNDWTYINRSIGRDHDFIVGTMNHSVQEKYEAIEELGFNLVPKKQLIVVTPTNNRAMQAYFLHRLSHVLRLVQPPLLWLVVEMDAASKETAELLRKTGVMYRHLVSRKNTTTTKDRAVQQRNAALEHIELHKLDGVVYFAEDDNIYSVELFENLRQTSGFRAWPIAMLAPSESKAILEGPVCNGSQVIGWHTSKKSKPFHRLHVDMSGFAFNSTMLWDPVGWRRRTSDVIRQLGSVEEGLLETTFIEQVVEDETQMEAVPAGCSPIMNWRLHLDAYDLNYPTGWLLQTDLDTVLPLR